MDICKGLDSPTRSSQPSIAAGIHTKVLNYSCHIFMFVNTPAYYVFLFRATNPFRFLRGIGFTNPFRFLLGMIGFSNPFRYLRGIGFSNPFRFVWWKLWMLYYCWPFELQDDWNACCCAATAAAVPVIASRLGPRLPAASLRGLLLTIVRLNHGCRVQHCLDQWQWGLQCRQGCQSTCRARQLNTV